MVAWTRLVKHFSKRDYKDNIEKLHDYIRMRTALDHPVIPQIVSVYEDEAKINVVQE